MTDRSRRGRADLARVVQDLTETDAIRLGAVVGFEIRSEGPRPPSPRIDTEETGDGTSADSVPVTFEQGETRPVPFWMPVRYAKVPRRKPSGPSPPPPPDVAALPVWQAPPRDPPPWPPLRSWRSLQDLLRRLLAVRGTGPEIDLERAVDRLSECRVLGRPPRRPRPKRGNRCVVVLDRDRRLVPLWRDQEMVLAALTHAAPHMTVTPVTWDPGSGTFQPMGADRAGPVEPCRDGTPWLVLSDLGAVTGRDPDLLVTVARSLDPDCAIALTVTPPGHLPPDVRTAWRAEPWEDVTFTQDDLDRNALVRKLLICLSPAFCFTPGMLRAMRRTLLPEADALVECMTWNDPAVECLASVATALTPEATTALRAAFAGDALTDAERTDALSVIRAWRTGGAAARVGEDYWFPEVLNLPAELRDRCLPHPADLDDARRYFEDLDRRRCGHGAPLTLQTRAWLSQMGDCAPRAFQQESSFRNVVWSVKATETSYTPPHGDLPDVGVPAVGRVSVIHDRSDWVLTTAPDGAGSPVVTLDCEDGVVDIAPCDGATPYMDIERTFPWRGRPNEKDPLDPVRRRVGSGVIARVPLESVALASDKQSYWSRIGQALADDLSWASATGRDALGLWADVRIEDVTQRLRWIPPGRFLMGSWKDEPERFNDEGPQHEVTLATGFWLFDTPCTQALWQAVMGDKPSGFQSPDRPVEQVSWDDVQIFLERFNARVPGLALTLTSEAQWEYACRANAEPPSDLDAVAWYGANSDDQTHPVGQKQPNAWGLHDMLGNVDEWCLDHWHDSYEGAPVDGTAWLDDAAGAGAHRVIRRGSWDDSARNVRAAYRGGTYPVVRSDTLGFRCSRGPVSPASGGAEPAEQGRQAERRPAPEAGGDAPDRDVVHVGDGSGRDASRLPTVPALVIRTDREQVILEQCTLRDHPWAEAMGRDRFGLWARIALEVAEGPPVTQRMRWIPPGRFLMGSPEDEPERYDNEGPQHEVTLAQGFWLFDTPCTQALWQAVMGENLSIFKSPDRPVEQVSWNDAQTFLQRINDRIPGLGLTLPSEARWEYACRAGGEASSDLGAVAWYDRNSGRESHPVGQKQPNALGLHDMLGNVWEWCADPWHETYDGAPADGTSWQDADTGAYRVIRGGSWVFARYVRAAVRDWTRPDDRVVNLGFRCSRVLP